MQAGIAPLPGASPLANDSSTTAVPFSLDTKGVRQTEGLSITHTLSVCSGTGQIGAVQKHQECVMLYRLQQHC